jgi:hypothetical protein
LFYTEFKSRDSEMKILPRISVTALLTGRKIAKIREVFADPLLLNKCARSSSRGSHKGAPTRAKL